MVKRVPLSSSQFLTAIIVPSKTATYTTPLIVTDIFSKGFGLAAKISINNKRTTDNKILARIFVGCI